MLVVSELTTTHCSFSFKKHKLLWASLNHCGYHARNNCHSVLWFCKVAVLFRALCAKLGYAHSIIDSVYLKMELLH